MSMIRREVSRILTLVFLAGLVLATASQPVLALSDKETNLHGQNSIFFYDPHGGCIDKNGESNDNTPTEDWDGHCSDVGAYNSQIFKYFSSIYTVAQNNGLPWEGLMAQLIGESSFMANEVCPFNPLGLKGSPSCDGKHRSFNSYDEAFLYYVNDIVPVKKAKGKFADDPYGYVEFLINGVPGYKYATDPEYINKISGYVCGLQKWAQKNNQPISGSAAKTNGSRSSNTKNTAYCSEYNDEDDDDDEKGNCFENGTCNGYVFPLKGATKANYLNGNSLSPLPCRNFSMGGCHHDYYAMDLGLSIGTKTESDYPDLVGKFTPYYWKSVGVKVVAMSSGKIISYKPYSRATLGYQSKCASVVYQTNDGRKFWLGHMSYDSRYKAGDTFGTGDVIGEVGPPPCAVSTQAHLHVDETLTYGNDGSVKTVELINTLYERLP